MANKKNSIPKIQVPFDKAGNQLAYDGWNATHEADNYVFEGYLTLDGMSRGRSAANFTWKDDAGKTYSMFMTDMLAVVKTRTVEHGRVYGKWTFCKRGANYGVCMYQGD